MIKSQLQMPIVMHLCNHFSHYLFKKKNKKKTANHIVNKSCWMWMFHWQWQCMMKNMLEVVHFKLNTVWLICLSKGDSCLETAFVWLSWLTVFCDTCQRSWNRLCSGCNGSAVMFLIFFDFGHMKVLNGRLVAKRDFSWSPQLVRSH